MARPILFLLGACLVLLCWTAHAHFHTWLDTNQSAAPSPLAGATTIVSPKQPTYRRTYYPRPARLRKRTVILEAQTGYEWAFSVGCALMPDEVDRIVTAFFDAAEYSQSLPSLTSVRSDPAAIPCYVTKVTQNAARSYVTLHCESPTAVNVSRLDTFLRNGTILPLECRSRVLVTRGQAIRVKTVTTQPTPNLVRWGLDRLDQRGLPLSHSYTYAYDGAGVTVCIVDTGVWCDHEELAGRCTSGGNFVDDGSADVDDNGHGSHCAGICCGTTYGPAKGASVRSYRVLDATGSGTFGYVMDALMMIEDEFIASPHMMVVSMSLSGPIYTPVNDLVNTLAVFYGIPVVVAAGNSGDNTNNYSPGSASGATPVAASDMGDLMPYWSNRGGNTKCAAPGVDITSILTKTTNGWAVKSGTSMAAPLVAGTHALMFQYLNATANSSTIPFGLDVTTAVLNMASHQRVNGYSLVFSSIGLDSVPQLPATPPQIPSSASILPKPIQGLPSQPLSYLRSASSERFGVPVFLWFMSSPLLTLLILLHV